MCSISNNHKSNVVPNGTRWFGATTIYPFVDPLGQGKYQLMIHLCNCNQQIPLTHLPINLTKTIPKGLNTSKLVCNAGCSVGGHITLEELNKRDG